MKRQWYYRGSLKSCNYACSYCPFSKKKENRKELRKDQAAWLRFVEYINRQKNAGGAVQIVPYGEALIHPYYWEGMAELSKNPAIDAVGAQSNFSFPAEQMIAHYLQCGGTTDKLRLWGTFHPEMTTAEKFVEQCLLLSKRKILYCAGAVGNPANIRDIQHLRSTLPPSVYLWINKMDGMKRNYTESEKKAFLDIDPYFEMELIHHRAAPAKCGNSLFIESDGTMHRCNLCRQNLGNLYAEPPIDSISDHKNIICTRKECSCYLAYCNLKEETMAFFEPYPAFRIPKYPKAVFFDIDGTLIPEGQTEIPQKTAEKLRHLSKHSTIYLATSRPCETARKGLRQVWDIIAGGTFAGGARQKIWKGETLDIITPMETEWLHEAEALQKKIKFRIRKYKKEDRIYKVTLVYPKGRLPEIPAPPFTEEPARHLKIPSTCQLLWEEPCLQVTARGTGKLEGILQICGKMGYQREEVAVFGSGENDQPMIDYFKNRNSSDTT